MEQAVFKSQNLSDELKFGSAPTPHTAAMPQTAPTLNTADRKPQLPASGLHLLANSPAPDGAPPLPPLTLALILAVVQICARSMTP